MTRKIRVGVLFGGQSAEHEVSLQSAKNVIEALDKEKYEPVLIGIDKEGGWHAQRDVGHFLLHTNDPKAIHLNVDSDKLAMIPKEPARQFVSLSQQPPLEPLDVVFPVLHGPFGEDGTVQGLLKLMGVPFVGAGVLGSAVGMDKDVMKRLLQQAGIPTARFITVNLSEKTTFDFQAIVEKLGAPVFIKPANLGSSVGIAKVHTAEEFAPAIETAFQFDRKILIEEAIRGREVECSVLGNEHPMASVPGEVVTDRSKHAFYSYEAKYLDEHGALLNIPATLTKAVTERVQELAIQTFQTLCCEGMARVDFFVTDDEQVLVNELNSIPGFTKISMYPKLWAASGIGYTELIDRLIQLAIERYDQEKRLKITYF